MSILQPAVFSCSSSTLFLFDFAAGVTDSEVADRVRKALDAGDGETGGRKTLLTWVFSGGGASGK